MQAYNIYIFEAVAASGVEWYLVTGGEYSIWVNKETATDPIKLLRALARAGMPISDKEPAKALQARWELRKPYNGVPPLDRPGSSGNAFAWPDGAVVVPKGHPEPVTIFQPISHMFPRHGTLKGWLSTAATLHDQPLLIFAMLLPFASALKRLIDPIEDTLLEIIVPTYDMLPIHHAVASVTGGLRDGVAYQAVTFLEALGRSPEVEAHVDQLLVLNDASLFFASRGAAMRANDARQLLSRQLRAVSEPHSPSRMILLVDETPLAGLVGEDSDMGRLLSSGRMHTFRIPPGRPFGIFERLPKGVRHPYQWANQLEKEMKTNRGVAHRRFIRCLVEKRADDSRNLLAIIEHRMDLFASKVPHDSRDSAVVRTIRFLGLVYAAGYLAENWSLLPSNWKVGPLLKSVFQNYYAAPGPIVPFLGEVKALVNHPDALHVGQGKPKLSKSALDAGCLFVDHGRHGVDVVIRKNYLGRYIKNGHRRLNDREVVELLQRDGRHQTIKKRKITGNDTRLYVFRLPIDVSPSDNTSD